MIRRIHVFGGLMVVAVLLLAFSGVASAAKGGAGGSGGGGKGGKPTSGSSSLTLVTLNSTDGLPHWGQQITFNVSTTATTEPHVNVSCSQNGAVVYGAATGYYASYPWPWTQTMTLSSQTWTGGAADCTAVLQAYSGTSVTTLTTLGFHVDA
jgi:hypothetical protein